MKFTCAGIYVDSDNEWQKYTNGLCQCQIAHILKLLRKVFTGLLAIITFWEMCLFSSWLIFTLMSIRWYVDSASGQLSYLLGLQLTINIIH